MLLFPIMRRDPNKLVYDKAREKGVMFFSSSSVQDCRYLLESSIYEILVSIFYLRKNPSFYEAEFFPELKSKGGLFMIDSGGHTYLDMFYRNTATPEMFKEEFWTPKIEEYVEYLDSHSDSIFSAANYDMDFFVGRGIVDKWNDKYFKPLEKKMNIVYVIHESYRPEENDPLGYDQIEYYCKNHKYVGASGTRHFVENARRLYLAANYYGTRIHGFGWTSLPTLKTFPFFSVDSTTWLGGVRYGTSYRYDGKNFRVTPYYKKYLRKVDKLLCLENGVDYEALLRDEREAVNMYNLIGWKGARKEYLRYCSRLRTKNVIHYC